MKSLPKAPSPGGNSWDLKKKANHTLHKKLTNIKKILKR